MVGNNLRTCLLFSKWSGTAARCVRKYHLVISLKQTAWHDERLSVYVSLLVKRDQTKPGYRREHPNWSFQQIEWI